MSRRRRNRRFEPTLDPARSHRPDAEAIPTPPELPPDRIDAMRQAHAEWQAQPEDERGPFNVHWLATHGYSTLYNWAKQHGGIRALAEATGSAVAADLELAGRPAAYTPETAMARLREAHAAWSQLPKTERGDFSTSWLAQHGYSGLYEWALKQGGLASLVEGTGGDVARDFVRPAERAYRTEETAIAELQAAHTAWRQQPEDERGPFNPKWLVDNGYAALQQWAFSHGGIEALVAKAGEVVANDFTRLERRENLTVETAAQVFREAYALWLRESAAAGETFNYQWLRRHRLTSPYAWAAGHNQLEAVLAAAGAEIHRDFERMERSEPYTPESAVEKLRLAYQQWRAEPPESRGNFSPAWLNQHGFSGLTDWAQRHDGLTALVNRAGRPLAVDFTTRDQWTEAKAREILTEAHAEWKTRPAEAETLPFNPQWLKVNGYANLYVWGKAHGGIEALVEATGGEVARDFSRRELGLELRDTQIAKLRAAHAEWQALPEAERGKFNISWLRDHGYSGISAWAERQGDGMDALVAAAGDEVAADFVRKAKSEKFTNATAAEQLRQAFAAWNREPAESRRSFTRDWLSANGYAGLVRWTRTRPDGLAGLANAVGTDVAAAYQEFASGEGFTKESAVAALQQAHEKWRAQTEVDRGRFNVSWLRRSGYKNLSQWVNRREGILPYIEAAGPAVVADFEHFERSDEYTLESAAAIMREAHAAWLAEPAESRGPFNIKWLYDNGYRRIYDWAIRANGIEAVVVAAGEAVEKDFEIRKVEPRDRNDALAALREAFAKWREEPEDTRGPLNRKWLSDNGYQSLVSWVGRHWTIEELVAAAGDEVSDVFEIRHKGEKYTRESALARLREAHQDWLTQPSKDRGPWNIGWLKRHGYGGMYLWAKGHGGIDSLIQAAGPEIRADFHAGEAGQKAKNEERLAELREAHALWSSGPAETRGAFNARWLKDHGYAALYSWTQRQGGIEQIVADAGGQVAADFEKQEKRAPYTLETAIVELQRAHAAWLTQPAETRGPLNSTWLRENGFDSVYQWANRAIGMPQLVAAAGDDVAKNFERRKKGETQLFTPETAIASLRVAHAEWLAQMSEDLGQFNATWLNEHGYSSLVRWGNNHGGIEALADQAGGEVSQDFESRKNREPYTLESAVATLREAHAAWFAQPAEMRGVFSRIWLEKNGYGGLVQWASTHVGIPDLVAAAGGQAAQDFTIRGQQFISASQPEPLPERRETGGFLPSEDIDLRLLPLQQLEAVLEPVLAQPEAAPKPGERRALAEGERGEGTEMQKLRLLLGQAHRTGEWSDELVDRFIELHSYQPDYVFHQLAANDVLGRAERGEIAYPSTILSVAGGAYGEAIAWQRLQERLQTAKQDLPIVVNLDNSTRMLVRAAQMVRQEYHIADELLEGVYGDMLELKESVLRQFHTGDFDLIEISALHYVPAKEQARVLAEAIELLKPGQLLRLVAQDPIPPELITAIQDHGAELLTAPDAVVTADPAQLGGTTETQRDRIRQKIGGGRHYLLAQKQAPTEPEPPITVETPAVATPGLPPLPPTTETPAQREVQRRLRRLRAQPMEKRSRTLMRLVDELGMVNIPDAALTELGYQKRLVKGRGQKPDTMVIEQIK